VRVGPLDSVARADAVLPRVRRVANDARIIVE
jgi:hypothetical protein